MHALWHDQVADPARRDARTVVAREVVIFLRDSEEFVPTLEGSGFFGPFVLRGLF